MGPSALYTQEGANGSPDLSHSPNLPSYEEHDTLTSNTPHLTNSSPSQNGRHSAKPPRRGRGGARSSSTTRLGAIDEMTSNVRPDIPVRNPRRNAALRYVQFFGFGLGRDDDENLPPLNAYDSLTGPRGEKFSDVRANRTHTTPTRGKKWRRLVCLGLVIFLVIAIALGVGLGVGLTRNKDHGSSDSSEPSSSPTAPPTTPAPFPVGTWRLTTYLTEVNSSCTPNDATFTCYPGQTYSQAGASGSTSTLVWDITSPTNSTLNLRISSADPTFAYPFQGETLTLVDTSNLLEEAFIFSSSFRKIVFPSVPLTNDNAITRCYYNNTLLSARLYATAAGAGGLGNATSTSSGGLGTSNDSPNVRQDWPYAIEFSETVSEQPTCYIYANGEDGAQVTVTGSNSVSGGCECRYQNYGVQ